MTRVPEIRVLWRIPGVGVAIYWYGLMLLTGFAAGMWLARRLARRGGVKPETIYDLAVWALLSGLLGARLWYVIENAGVFYAVPPDKPLTFLEQVGRTINVTDGGLVYYGGILAPVVVLLWWFRRRRLSAWRMFDILAAPAMLGLVFGRIGCFFNGCCFGSVCSPTFPLAIQRPRLGPTWEFHVERLKQLDAAAPWSLPVHPAQLYEAAGVLVICALLVLLYRRRRRDGDVLAALLILYPALRIAMESLRAHEAPAMLGPISVAQAFSAATILGGVALLAMRRRRPEAVSAAAAPAAPAPSAEAQAPPKSAERKGPPRRRRPPPHRH